MAGHCTLVVERLTDSAVAERLAACRPWVRALLARMLHHPTVGLPQQRCRQLTSQYRHQPNLLTLWLAGRVLVLTTLLPTLLPGPTALALYRVRWQLEIAIKRWKSVLDLDLLRARYGNSLADVWEHGKLLYMLLLDACLRRTLGRQWSWLDRARTATWWRPWKLLRDEVAPGSGYTP